MRGYQLNEIFAACPPGLEPALMGELEAIALPLSEPAKKVAGGVELRAENRQDWMLLMQECNLRLRSATRVLARLARFPVHHLAQLDKRAHRVDWSELLPRNSKVHVDASCRRSRIYHSDAAAQRVFKATADGVEAHPAKDKDDDSLRIFVRIERDLCTISLDSTGVPLYRRGAKRESAKAPLRENLAAGFLMLATWDPAGGEALCDPMCGSGSILLEGADLALGRAPGLRRGFAFESFKIHDRTAFEDRKQSLMAQAMGRSPVAIAGSDINAGAMGASRRNLERAGLAEQVTLAQQDLSEARPPAARGLLLVNPPYGKRIGRDSKEHIQLHKLLGQVFRDHFPGWRLGLISPHVRLAEATGLAFSRISAAIPHGGLKVKLYLS